MTRKQEGWTLIEMLVVMSLIAVLASLALVQYRNSIQTAKEAVLKADLFHMRDAIDQYYADKGSYPASLQSLVSDGYLRRILDDPITDVRMTRFWITLGQAVRFVVDSFDRLVGGELFIPKIPSTTVVDLARAIAPDAELIDVGIRPGEKLHEEMISEDDARRGQEFDDYYVITPVLDYWEIAEFQKGDALREGFIYRSDTNDMWLGVEELRQLLTAL